MGRHERGDGRRRASSRFRVIRVAAGVIDFFDTVIDYVAVLLHPEAGSVLPLDPPFASSGASSRRMRVPWRKAVRVASTRSFPEGPWTEHRVGVVVGGARANHYVAARPSSPGFYDILLARRTNRGGHCSLYKDTSQAVIEEATDLGLVRWMPVGIHADAITRTHFRRATESTEPLTTLTMWECSQPLILSEELRDEGSLRARKSIRHQQSACGRPVPSFIRLGLSKPPCLASHRVTRRPVHSDDLGRNCAAPSSKHRE